MQRNGIIYFLKYPEYGKIKPELVQVIGEKHATNLYKCFVYDTFQTIQKTSHSILVSFSPPSFQKSIKKWFIGAHHYIPQIDINESQNIVKAFQAGFNLGYENLILIKGDSPLTTLHNWSKLFLALENFDTVMGPTTDGSFNIIGFSQKSFDPLVFQNLTDHNKQIISQTINRFLEIDKTTFMLPKTIYVNNMVDLVRLYTHMDKLDNKGYTFQYLNQHNLLALDEQEDSLD